jgi:DNA invertase Pin-like site-specific DNA recombinase
MQPIVLKKGATAYGYVRVSTDRQENSPQAQAKILNDWAAEQGYPIELAYDTGVSAAKLEFEKRPAGRELLRRIQPGDVIAAVRLDRLFRRGQEIALLRRLAQQDIRIVTVVDSLPDTSTPVGKYIQGNFVLMHELEAAIIGARIRETMAWRKSMGLPVNGAGKYGHKIVPGEKGQVFEVDEEEMQLIRQASERRLAGESCQDIATDFGWDRCRVARVTLQYWLANDIEPPEQSFRKRPTPEEEEQRRLERITWAQDKPVWIIHGQRCKRLVYDDVDQDCPDCGVSQGMYHVPGCSQEECPLCKGQAATCNCKPRLPHKRPKRKEKPVKRKAKPTWKDAGWIDSPEPPSDVAG